MKCDSCGHINKTPAALYSEKTEGVILKKYGLPSEIGGRWVTATEILQSLGVKKITVRDTRAVAACFHKIYDGEKGFFRQSGARKLIKVWDKS